MKFYVYSQCGFCSGVQRAINLASQAAQCQQPVYCLGELVHNATVIADLTRKGIITVNSAEEIQCGATVVIRAHGVAPCVTEQLQAKNVRIIDATCPYVRRIQQRAKQYYADGFTVVLVGDAKHPEIIGINGWCDNNAIVTDGSSVVDVRGRDKVLIMFQTTFDCQLYSKSLQNILTDNVKTLEIFNTICYTTTDRQSYARYAAKLSDMVVIVGDKHSSNTNKLYEIANRYCNNILWLNDDNVPEDLDLSKYETISFLAGASTPKELMKGVLKRMSEIAKEPVEVVSGVADNDASKAHTDEALFEQAVSKMSSDYHVGQKVKARVVVKDADGVHASLQSAKYEAFIPNDQLTIEDDYQAVKDSLKEGDVLECQIISTDKGIKLSRRAIEERMKDDEIVEDIKQGKEFQCVMRRKGNECLIGRLGSYRVIVHASQIKLGFVKNLDAYIGKTLRLVASPEKINDEKHTIFASQKAILLAEKKAKEDAFWNNIEVNEIVEGKVLRFAPFGAFVSVRDFDCLAHTSDLSWDRINNPADVLEIGKTYEFVVLALDREKNRVSLGYKQLQPKPWDIAAEKFAVGTVVKGKVARIMDFGAFVELDKHIDGLLHISNVSWDWLDDINKALKVGDEVEVKVMEFDADNKRITLSRKALLPKPEDVAVAEEQTETKAE